MKPLKTHQIKPGDILKIIEVFTCRAHDLALKGIGVGSVIKVSDVDPSGWSGIYCFDTNNDEIHLGTSNDISVVRATKEEEARYCELNKTFRWH